MHCNLGNATLLQLPFPRESNPNFPMEKSEWDDPVVKNNNSKKQNKNPSKSRLEKPEAEPQPPEYYTFMHAGRQFHMKYLH